MCSGREEIIKFSREETEDLDPFSNCPIIFIMLLSVRIRYQSQQINVNSCKMVSEHFPLAFPLVSTITILLRCRRRNRFQKKFSTWKLFKGSFVIPALARANQRVWVPSQNVSYFYDHNHYGAHLLPFSFFFLRNMYLLISYSIF